MQDNHYFYFCLNVYLLNADSHYVEGRFLWLNHGIQGACNLLWLAVEQLITLVILDKRLIDRSIDNVEIKHNGNTQVLIYDPQEQDIKVIDKIISRTLYKIERKHRLDRLLDILKSETDIALDGQRSALEKLKEYHDRRYYENSGSSINLGLLDEIDMFYFTLRGSLSETIPRSLIDEIAFQKEFPQGHPLPLFSYAYVKNQHFASRKHPVVNQMTQNGQTIKNDGVENELFS